MTAMPRENTSLTSWPVMLSYHKSLLYTCPGFSQDRVNFHQKPGRGTAGWADPTPTWPNRAGYSIPCAVMVDSSGGGGTAGTHSRLGNAGVGLVRESGSLGRAVRCCVFSLSVLLLLLFPLFVVLLNCPYPDPPVFCLFLSILLRTLVGGGAAAWRFCYQRQPKTRTTLQQNDNPGHFPRGDKHHHREDIQQIRKYITQLCDQRKQHCDQQLFIQI